jgi:hypothetical protein
LLAILLGIAPLASVFDVDTPPRAAVDDVALTPALDSTAELPARAQSGGDFGPVTPRPGTLLLVGIGVVALDVVRQMSVRRPPNRDRRR